MYMLTKCTECGNTEIFAEVSNNMLFRRYRNECVIEHVHNTAYHILPSGHCVECASDDYLDAMAERLISRGDN